MLLIIYISILTISTCTSVRRVMDVEYEIRFRPRVRNILWLRRKLVCVAQFCIFCGMPIIFPCWYRMDVNILTFIFQFTVSLPTPGNGKCVLGTFLPEAPCRHTRDEVTTDPVLFNMKNNISFEKTDIQYHFKIVNPALPCTTLNVGCDLLKFVCDTKMVHRNTNWSIWAMRNYKLQ